MVSAAYEGEAGGDGVGTSPFFKTNLPIHVAKSYCRKIKLLKIVLLREVHFVLHTTRITQHKSYC